MDWMNDPTPEFRVWMQDWTKVGHFPLRMSGLADGHLDNGAQAQGPAHSRSRGVPGLLSPYPPQQHRLGIGYLPERGRVLAAMLTHRGVIKRLRPTYSGPFDFCRFLA